MAGCRPADFGLCPTPDILEAREWNEKGEVTGILYIPSDFETRVARGETFRIHPVCRHGRIPQLQGIARSKLARDACRKRCPPACRNSIPAAARSVGRCVVHSRQRIGNALYNYTEGYGSYLIPAVMIVIIFQTMLMVIAMLTGEEAEQRRKGIHSMRARS